MDRVAARTWAAEQVRYWQARKISASDAMTALLGGYPAEEVGYGYAGVTWEQVEGLIVDTLSSIDLGEPVTARAVLETTWRV